MKTDELRIELMDLECMKSIFCYCGWNKQDGKRYQYEVSHRKNELDALVKHLKEDDLEYIVAYNGVRYDIQIIQYILDNHEKWYDKSAQEVIQLISMCSQEAIDRSNYDMQPLYKEYYLDVKCIDPFKIHHYDNKNRRVGLKTLEFAMDLENIQEMPVDWRKESMTDEELDTVLSYCWNDVEALIKFWNITIGNTDNEIYKGKDMVQARLDVIEEIGFNHTALNWSNSKIGDEINKKGYMQETGCTIDDIYKKKKNRGNTPSFTFDSCIPDYIRFNSKIFNDLRKQVHGVKVSMIKDDQEFIVKYNNTTYSIMRGGIHSHDGPRILETTATHIIRDADIGGQYPRTIVKRSLYPSHLGPKWLIMYDKQGQKRTGFKQLAKTSVKYKGMAETWKDVLNAGGYGQTNQPDNWQYDPRVMYTCTIGNQFEILMLIEWLEDSGIQVVSANTDGIVCIIPVELESTYMKLCDRWEKVVGNDVIGKLEYTDYKKLVQRDVNNYMAIKMDGSVKTKGVFEIDKLLHKNKSNTIRSIALVNWFRDGITPEETIEKDHNIYHYVIGEKSSAKYSYKGVDRKTGESNEYDQIVRYVLTTKGEKLYKIAKPGSDAKKKQTECKKGKSHQLLVNKIPSYKVIDELSIDREWYIDQVWKIIEAIQPEYKMINKRKKNKQTALF